MPAPGRSCPSSYYYGARALRAAPALEVESLWIAGGLYGNTFALDALLAAYEHEPGAKALVFNGDFHWFDVDAADFGHIDHVVLAFHATRGNVETELATPQDGAGCGCGYPDWVDDGTVARSNRIFERLRATASRSPQALARLAALPMHLAVRVGDARVAIVHGDAQSLAGWDFSQEALATQDGLRDARAAFAAAGADVFASSHTCLPVLQCFDGGRVLVNNGAAGMPNFAGTRYGLLTRIATRAFDGPERLYGAEVAGAHVEALRVDYDHARWLERFVASWPPGSPAHASYHRRIVEGARHDPAIAAPRLAAAT